jgi:CrcB protein
LDKYIAVALGGALGATARFWISSVVSERFPTRFPLGTLIINVTGSLIVGFFLTLVTERINIHPNLRLAVAVGFVGAYTTFSTFEYETFRLLETGSGITGFMNVILSLMLGFLAVWGGIALARQINSPTIVHQGAQSRIIRKTNVKLASEKGGETIPDRESIQMAATDQSGPSHEGHSPQR